MYKSYGLILTCTRLSGWELVENWGGTTTLIGGEWSDKKFRIIVKGIIICDNYHRFDENNKLIEYTN